jgi:hypothetical protein
MSDRREERVVERLVGTGALVADDGVPYADVRYFVTVFQTFDIASTPFSQTDLQETPLSTRLVVDLAHPLEHDPVGIVTLALQDGRQIDGWFSGREFQPRGGILPASQKRPGT